MTLQATFGSRRTFFAKLACSSLFVLLVFPTASTVSAQSSGGPTVRVEPVGRASGPFESPAARPSPSARRTGKRRTSAAPGGAAKLPPADNSAPANDQNSTDAPADSSALNCPQYVYLVQDVIGYEVIVNGQPNTTYSVNIIQDSPAILDFAPSFFGPFGSTSIVVSVTTDATGYGKTEQAFWLKGLQVGQTNIYAQIGTNTSGPRAISIIPQCHCPPIPVTQ